MKEDLHDHGNDPPQIPLEDQTLQKDLDLSKEHDPEGPWTIETVGDDVGAEDTKDIYSTLPTTSSANDVSALSSANKGSKLPSTISTPASFNLPGLDQSKSEEDQEHVDFKSTLFEKTAVKISQDIGNGNEPTQPSHDIIDDKEQKSGEKFSESRSPVRPKTLDGGNDHNPAENPLSSLSNASDSTSDLAIQSLQDKAATIVKEMHSKEEHPSTHSDPDASAEFAFDSDPLESSSSSDSSSSISDDDGASSDEDPDGDNSDVESVDTALGSASRPLRTKNEQPDPVMPKPNINITLAMHLQKLGQVDQIFGDTVIVKASISGEYRVLEAGSVLCLEDKYVIGAVAETFGRVEQPYYSVRFSDVAEISEAGISKGSSIFYVEEHSAFVFTQPLKAVKGYDTSNIHDEEADGNEVEFSDDEKELAYKRQMKSQKHTNHNQQTTSGIADGFSKWPKRGRRGTNRREGGGRGRNSRGRGGGAESERLQIATERDDRNAFQHEFRNQEMAGLTYDDNDGGDDLYTPLTRPANLHEMMARTSSPPCERLQPNDFSSESKGASSGPVRSHRGGNNARGSYRGRGHKAPHRHQNGNMNHPRSNQESEPYSNGPSPSVNHSSSYNQYQHPMYGHNGAFDNSNYSHGTTNPYPPHANNYEGYYNTANQQQYPSNNNNNNYHPERQEYPNSNYEYHNTQFQQHQQHQPPQHQLLPNFDHHYHPYHPQQRHSPSYSAPYPSQTSQPPYIPPGAYVNPAFFPSPPPPRGLQQQWQLPSGGSGGGGGGSPHDANAAFQAAQERLELLKKLSPHAVKEEIKRESN